MQLLGHPINRSKKVRAGSIHDHEKSLVNPRHWGDHNVEYDYNRFGFRTSEFKDVVWEDSIVLLGCSCTVGIGLAEEFTVAGQLQNLTKAPVVNLGVSGSGIDHASWNSVIIHDHFPTPVAIVQLWTDTSRYTDLHNNKVDSYYPNRTDYYAKLNWEARSVFYKKTDKSLWEGKLKYFEATFFHNTSKVLNCDFIPTEDQALDGMHPGIQSNRKMAELIAKRLFPK